MKKLVRYVVLVIVISCGTLLVFSNNELKADNYSSGGRCTGSVNCRACTNCSRCAHCGSGGTCGVCASYSAPEPTYKAPKSNPKTNSKGNHRNSSTSSSTNNTDYIVNSKTLNVRSAASTTSSIIYTLKYGDSVTLIKEVNDKWFYISISEIKGYVSSSFISKKQ